MFTTSTAAGLSSRLAIFLSTLAISLVMLSSRSIVCYAYIVQYINTIVKQLTTYTSTPARQPAQPYSITSIYPPFIYTYQHQPAPGATRSHPPTRTRPRPTHTYTLHTNIIIYILLYIYTYATAYPGRTAQGRPLAAQNPRTSCSNRSSKALDRYNTRVTAKG
jgi:hypothetical protein